MATCAYIDLNPVAAGLAAAPEHTSIKQRAEHVAAHGRVDDVKAAEQGSVAAVARSSGLEESHWLCPIEDRRGVDSSREGMIAGFTLGNYLLLVDYTGRLFREGKATISRELDGVFARLGSDAERWQARLLKLSEGRLLGRFFAATRERLRAAAARLGVHGTDRRFGAGFDREDGASRPVRSVRGEIRAGRHVARHAATGAE